APVANRRPSERRIYKENQCRLNTEQFEGLVSFFRTRVYDARVLHTAAITFLYLIAIFGWGELVCACLLRRTNDSIDYIASRLVLGCFGLYAGFVLLSLGDLLKRIPVALVLACGLIAGIVSLRAAGRRLRDIVRDISGWPNGRRALFGMICLLAVLQIICGLTPLIL